MRAPLGIVRHLCIKLGTLVSDGLLELRRGCPQAHIVHFLGFLDEESRGVVQDALLQPQGLPAVRSRLPLMHVFSQPWTGAAEQRCFQQGALAARKDQMTGKPHGTSSSNTSAPYELSLTPPAPAGCRSRPTDSPDQSAVADEGCSHADEGQSVRPCVRSVGGAFDSRPARTRIAPPPSGAGPVGARTRCPCPHTAWPAVGAGAPAGAEGRDAANEWFQALAVVHVRPGNA